MLTTAPMAKTGLVETGEDQALVIAGSAEKGVMLYSLDGKTYDAVIPTATDAGDYAVYYKVIGNEGYSDTEAASVTVTIAPKDIANAEITLGAALTYTGSEQTRTIDSVKVDGLDVTYTVSGDKGTAVGTYTLTVEGTGNFAGTATKEWSIAEASSGGSGDSGGRPSGGSSGGSSVPVYPPVIKDTDDGDVTVNDKRPEKGDKVTIIPAPDAGFVVDGVVVTDKNGKPVQVTDNGDGTYTFVQPTGKVTIEVIFDELIPLTNCPKDERCSIHPFTDADVNTWYHDGVHYCLAMGLMNGKSGVTFEPNSNITRQQAWMILPV